MTHPTTSPGRGKTALALDTSREALRLQVDLWRTMSAHDKARIVSEISRATQQLALAGIRLRHPEASERECMLRLAILNLGPDLARRVCPEVTELLRS